MTAPRRMRHQVLLGLARVAVVWERLWPLLWPVAAVAGTFAGLAMADALPALPGWLHALVLVLFVVALAWSVRRAVRQWRPLPPFAARHRLERDSALDHRPLTAIEDTIAGGRGDPGSEALWRRHAARMAAAARHLRLRLPAPDMARADPCGLRVLAILVLVIGLAGSGDIGNRFLSAMTPNFGSPNVTPIAVNAWITPPAYTRAAPVFLRSMEGPAASDPAEPQTEDRLQVPAGSALVVQVQGVSATPILSVDGQDTSFEALAEGEPVGTYRLEATVEGGERLAVRHRGRMLAEWPITVVPDQMPTISFDEPPAATPTDFVSFRYAASDDYGLVDVVAVVRHVDGGASQSGETELSLPLSLPELGSGEVKGGGVHDLTPHDWAGQSVTVHLAATDAAGQVGVSPPVTLELPERTFKHPVAQAVIAERKRLTADEDPLRIDVATGLAGLASKPEHFSEDVVVSLGLSVSRARLVHQRDAGGVPSVRRLLWDTALRIEQGAVPVAEQALREARQRLWEALRSDRDEAEIEQLMDELQQALEEYLDALAAELARRGETLPEMPPNAKLMQSRDLRELIEAARQLARSGARDSARQLLSELQRMLDAMRQGLNSNASAKDLVKAHQLMNALRSLAGQQQDLLDETYKRLQQLREGAARGESARPDSRPGEAAQPRPGAQDQEALRRGLGDLMLEFDEMLGGIPGTLGQAERAMKSAGESLEAGMLGDAVPRQTKAVELLQQATDQAAGMMSQKLGGLAGMFRGDPDEYEEDGSDPFGRNGEEGQRGFGSENVEIPDRMKIRRVEEIMHELRRRAGEYRRPESEREYINRLLRRF